MKQRLEDSLSAWFARYLIDQRVSTEPNNHQLYQRFLEALDRKVLWKLVEDETLVKSIRMLNDEEVQKSTAERAILKNLGSWFGTITLAKNKPIKYKNLAFKEFLLEGFDTNRLIVTIPFVCKTLEGAVKSKVFKPPNPWLMSILSLLAELYQFADLKLNLKFEIEVLYKALDLDLEKVEPTTLLRSRPLQDALGEPLLPDYLPDIGSIPIGGYDSNSVLQPDQQLLSLTGTNDSDGRRVVGAHIETVLAGLINSVTINTQLAPFNNDPSFRRAVQTAVDRTVREVSVERDCLLSRLTATPF
jgi:CCR4-NOT transcription complex subunit 1